VLLEEVEDLPRGGQRRLLLRGGLGGLDLLGDDLVAQLDALFADVHPGTGDQPLDLLLRLPAEGAFEHVGSIARTRHVRVLSSGRQQCAPRFPRERSPGRADRHHGIAKSCPITGGDAAGMPRPGPGARLRAEGRGCRCGGLAGPRSGEGHFAICAAGALRDSRTCSTSPYSSADFAVRILSRSMSVLTCSLVRPEWNARVSSIHSRMRMISFAWISRSEAWPPPPSPPMAG